jgi:hypothetical protein
MNKKFFKVISLVGIFIAISNIASAQTKDECIFQEAKDREYITVHVCPYTPDPPSCIEANEKRHAAQVKYCNTLPV